MMLWILKYIIVSIDKIFFDLSIINFQGKSWEALWNGEERKESGEKYGDEICNILSSELEMTEVRAYLPIYS